MCECCGCSGRPAQEGFTQRTTSERKPVHGRIATVKAAEARMDTLERRDEERPAETAAA